MFKFIGRSVLAASFTAGAFLLMSYLIAPGEMPPEPTDDDSQISITRKKRSEDSSHLKRELPSPPQSQNTPPPLMLAAAPQATLTNTGFGILTPVHGEAGPINPTINGNRRAIPMVPIVPDYPQRALAEGTEGWVMIEFTIAADGGVTDIVVVEADPKNTFDRAAIRAMGRWRYQPKMIDGRAVAQHHMREIFRFEITN